MIKLSVAQDYSKRTGLRYSAMFEYSGEDFYHACLNAKFLEAYLANDILELSFDGTDDGCGPSFIDESIGNLVYDFTLEVVEAHLKVISNDMPMWIDMIEKETYPDWEKRRQEKRPPKITEAHEAWTRLINDKLEKNVWISEITPVEEL